MVNLLTGFCLFWSFMCGLSFEKGMAGGSVGGRRDGRG
jgi:hypothetical protein